MLFHRKPDRTSQAVIDIGSASIKAVLVETKKKDHHLRPFKKLLAHLSPPEAKQGNSGYAQRQIIEKLHELIFTMVKELGCIPSKILIGVGSSMATCRMELWATLPLRGHQTVTKEDIPRYFKNAFEEHRQSNRTTLAFPLEITLNGYPAQPRDVNTTHVQDLGFRSLVLSFEEEIGQRLLDMQKEFGGLPIELVPSVLAQAEALVKTTSIPDALLIDIGGNETTLILIKESLILQCISFPFGSYLFSRMIQNTLGVPFTEAEDIQRHYTQGLLDSAKKSQLQHIFLQPSELWSQEFAKAMEFFYHIGPLGSYVFLTGGGAYLPEISAYIRKGDWIKIYSPLDVPNVRLWEARGIFGGDSLKGLLGGAEEVGLGALLYYTLHHEPIF